MKTSVLMKQIGVKIMGVKIMGMKIKKNKLYIENKTKKQFVEYMRQGYVFFTEGICILFLNKKSAIIIF